MTSSLSNMSSADLEKDHKNVETYVTTNAAPAERIVYDPSKESNWTRRELSFESFKRAPGATAGQAVHGDADPLKAQGPPAVAPARNEASSFADDRCRWIYRYRQALFFFAIEVGGCRPDLRSFALHFAFLLILAVGLFIGSGQALRNGGPLGILMAWLIIGVMLINSTQALGELAILYPVSGGFYTLAVRFLDPGLGMALGWNYFAQWAVTLPVELTVAGITVQYQDKAAAVPITAWITIFWIAVIAVNVFVTLSYAEEEFLSVVVIFNVVGIVFHCGGGKNAPYDSYLGGEYWNNPGALANGFKGSAAVFATAAFLRNAEKKKRLRCVACEGFRVEAYEIGCTGRVDVRLNNLHPYDSKWLEDVPSLAHLVLSQSPVANKYRLGSRQHGMPDFMSRCRTPWTRPRPWPRFGP